MIELINVSKKFNNLQILKNFNMTIDDKKITCLYGPSGIGKTTVANLVSNIISIDDGIIKGIENSMFSYVFQEPRLLEWYSVYDNIDFVLKDIYDSNTRQKKVNNYIDMVELRDYKSYKPKELSGGMAQRVSLARAFAYPSDILIMDEPFKGLDNKLKNEMISSFLKLWSEEKRTVLFITHDIDEAVLLSDTILILNNRPVEIVKKIEKNNYEIKDIKKMLINY
ncbi:MAG: ABC transporter ATP-binding protein [Bacilli bacterium]|nr:ABC transporter ATP-binding protein [Bacilli bacterium]MDD4779448.1 ABC transporter ATP-binding protein [Tissierellia bacterium]